MNLSGGNLDTIENGVHFLNTISVFHHISRFTLQLGICLFFTFIRPCLAEFSVEAQENMMFAMLDLTCVVNHLCLDSGTFLHSTNAN